MAGNSIKRSLEIAVDRLISAGCETARLDAELLLAHSLNKDRTWLYLYPDIELDAHQFEHFFNWITRREQREPVAYIIGRREFFALEFLVNSYTLIPRPETELLVETALQMADQHQPVTIADVGTGTGCIAISLARHLPAARIIAIDISLEAVQLARENATRHQLLDRITFLTGNLLWPLVGAVDLIVSNPPYVVQTELRSPSTLPEVHQYEPRLALDGGVDGMLIIRKLLSQAKEKLKPRGILLVEIGSSQGQIVMQLAKIQFPRATICVKKDLAGLDRLLVVQL